MECQILLDWAIRSSSSKWRSRRIRTVRRMWYRIKTLKSWDPGFIRHLTIWKTDFTMPLQYLHSWPRTTQMMTRRISWTRWLRATLKLRIPFSENWKWGQRSQPWSHRGCFRTMSREQRGFQWHPTWDWVWSRLDRNKNTSFCSRKRSEFRDKKRKRKIWSWRKIAYIRMWKTWKSTSITGISKTASE